MIGEYKYIASNAPNIKINYSYSIYLYLDNFVIAKRENIAFL